MFKEVPKDYESQTEMGGNWVVLFWRQSPRGIIILWSGKRKWNCLLSQSRTFCL